MFKTKSFWAFFIVAAGMTGPSWGASSPQRIGFQGKLLDTANNPRNGGFEMTFRIFDAPTAGTELWSETQLSVPVNNGVFSVQLGGNVALTAGLFNSASAYLEVQVSPDSAMAPRQQLLMSPYAFRALIADSLVPGDTNYIQVGTALQNGAAFHVSSATVAGTFQAAGPSSFTATGSQTYSLNTSSGIRLQAGTLRVEGSGGVEALGVVKAATVSATSGLLLPQGSAVSVEGAARWEPTQNLLFIGTGTASKTLVDTDSTQTLTNKTLSSSGGNTVDATHLRTRTISAVAPSDGMILEWNAGSSQWIPNYVSTVSVVVTMMGTALTPTFVASTVYLAPFQVSGRLTLNQIRYRVGVAAAGVTGDVGIYDTSGNLIASGGASSADFITTGVKVVNVVGAPKTIEPGQYYAAMTASGAGRPVVATLVTAGIVKGVGSIAAVGGTTLPASVTLSSIVDGFWGLHMSLNE
jgi:hypothetical protein